MLKLCFLALVAAAATAAPHGRGYTFDNAGHAAAVEASSRVASPMYQSRAAAPASVDWRTKGAVSPVRDQGQGETCW